MWRKLALGMLMLVALASLGMQPVSAQQTVVWNTEFYNNIYLLGTPALTRQDTAVAFDWGIGAPAFGVNADNFSARWAADPYFPAGAYRFYALADDAVRIWVDFQRLLDTFDQPRVGQIISADIVLSAGVHHIQVDYRENGGSAYLYVTWADLATNPTGPNFPTPVQVLPTIYVSPNYWTAQYYNNATLVGTPVLVQAEPWPLVRNWGAGSPLSGIPADNFSARWTTIHTVNAGTYRISVRADDGVRVFIDGRPVINEFHLASGLTYTADVTLIAGQHNLMVEYYEAGGLAFLEFALTPVVGATPAPLPAGTARVTASVLNVRQSPNCECSVIAKVRYGETYPIVGRNADSSWWQINVNGTIGWVFGRFTEVFNTASVPITDYSSAAQLPSTGYHLTTKATAVLRSRPGNRYAFLGQIAPGQTVEVVGRNADSTWWQVNHDGVVGWVRASLAVVEPAPDFSRIPVRG